MNVDRPSSDDTVIRPVSERGQRDPDQGDADQRHDADLRASAARAPADDAPLLDDEQAELFRRRWSDVQARFVDDPRSAVLDGDALVADLVSTLAQRFSQHKDGLEEQWSRGDEPSTEELRLALQQYRSFFHRLLST